MVFLTIHNFPLNVGTDCTTFITRSYVIGPLNIENEKKRNRPMYVIGSIKSVHAAEEEMGTQNSL